ncbi:BA75_01052T0 [Komagataella pastoris]|uniref:Vacuolar-sorting protein SNF7 n=1 Tax=Komagataella pastoris TaxID=4922 RepID=A0A1B2J7J2_PICPA|nr:BA75_01052T0 [Komagataella pastoris]
MFNYLFGGNNQLKKEAPKKAIVSLREHIALLNKKQQHLQNQMEEQDKLARGSITKNKTAAKTALKKKKTYEVQLVKILAQIDSLETQLTSIENANLNLETMKAMKQGAKAMKQIHGDFDVDKVDSTMDEIREQVELGEEISDAISRPLGTQEVDEDELEDELEELQQEELNNKLLETGSEPIKDPITHKMPDVSRLPQVWSKPENQVSQGKDEIEDEDEAALRALQEEMGMV